MGSQRVLPGKGVIFIKGLVFDTENRIQLKDFGEPLLDNLQKEVGGYIEVVHPKYLPEGLCMVVDDECSMWTSAARWSASCEKKGTSYGRFERPDHRYPG